MMREDSMERMLENARLPEIPTAVHRRALRDLVAREAEKRSRARSPLFGPIFTIGVSVGSVLGALFVLLMQDAHARVEAADTLGSTWCTYTDGRADGVAIWPPSSSAGNNNFVKSAPGYGGTGYAVRFTGTITGAGSPGYLGVGTFLGPQCVDGQCSGVDIRKFEKIRFMMKGSIRGGALVLKMQGGEGDADGRDVSPRNKVGDCEADITKFVTDRWRTVTLDLRDDFEGACGTENADSLLSDIRQVKWHVRGERAAAVDVWIDNLSFY